MDAATALLEDRVIPWHYGNASWPPSRPLRQEPAAISAPCSRRSPPKKRTHRPARHWRRRRNHAPSAAEFARQPRPATPPLGAKTSAAHRPEVRRPAREHRRRRTRGLPRRRHRPLDQTDHARQGLARNCTPATEQPGVRPTLRSPGTRCRPHICAVWSWPTGLLGDDFWLHGVIDHPAGTAAGRFTKTHTRGAPATPQRDRPAFHDRRVSARSTPRLL